MTSKIVLKGLCLQRFLEARTIAEKVIQLLVVCGRWFGWYDGESDGSSSRTKNTEHLNMAEIRSSNVDVNW
jgi:hypothetical protein